MDGSSCENGTPKFKHQGQHPAEPRPENIFTGENACLKHVVWPPTALNISSYGYLSCSCARETPPLHPQPSHLGSCMHQGPFVKVIWNPVCVHALDYTRPVHAQYSSVPIQNCNLASDVIGNCRACDIAGDLESPDPHSLLLTNW